MQMMGTGVLLAHTDLRLRRHRYPGLVPFGISGMQLRPVRPLPALFDTSISGNNERSEAKLYELTFEESNLDTDLLSLAVHVRTL